MTAALSVWWGRRNRRERVLALLVPLAALLLAADWLWLAPLRAQGAALQRELAAAVAQLDQMRQLAAEHGRGDSDRNERERSLEARRAAAEQAVRAAQIDLLPPQRMAEHLGDLLREHPRLRVLGAATLPPAPLEPAAAEGSAAQVRGALYRHGLELRIEGPYLDLLAYLTAIEERPQRVYWRELEMTVDALGQPVARITLFTLSREATWLKL